MKRHNIEVFSRLQKIVLAAALLWAATPATQASIFVNSTRWPLTPNGYAVVPLCIVAGSSTQQKGDGADAGLIHDTNPSLAAVVYHVKVALAESWARESSVRFVGFKDCEDLSDQERSSTVGVYIHPDTSNASQTGTQARGLTTADNPGTHFQPWGAEFNRCINYNWRTTHVEYSYDCVEQYAIHELGHAIGFKHEWFHPQTPQSCQDHKQGDYEKNGPIITSSYFTFYDSSQSYTIVNSADYDWDSIMTYPSTCAHVTGVRFGSKNLSDWDKAGVAAVYPPVPHGRLDVGVIPEAGGCRDSEPITIYMDDEDDDNESDAEGWIGESHVDRNTTLQFCRADGSLFGKMPPPAGDPRTNDYAVLKLGDVCPDGSVEISRHFDNEDDDNENYYSGDIAPSEQEKNTTLRFCLFRPENSGGTEMTEFPRLSYAYGVIARDLAAAVDNGRIHTDDEDSDNDNSLSAPDEETRQAAERLISFDRNTDLHFAKISDVGVSGTAGRSGWYTSGVTVSLSAGGSTVRFDLDGLGYQVYAGPFTIGADGIHSLSYYGADPDGTRLGEIHEATIGIDTQAPQISSSASPAANAFGWNNSDVAIHFRAMDEVSGVVSLSPDVALRGEGMRQSAEATASDMAGNTARFISGEVHIDKTPPVVSYFGNLGTYPADATIDIACSASDALSGVATDTCKPVQGPAYLFLPGANSFSATSTDRAGNIGSGATTFTMAATYTSVKNVVARLCGAPGVVDGLTAKLAAAQAAEAKGNLTAKANQLQAFVNQVNAQTGKSLTREAADILIRLAKAL
jgi:FIMAH domain-containing protein